MSDKSKLIGVNLDRPVLHGDATEGDTCPICKLGELAEYRHGIQPVDGVLYHCLLCGQKVKVVNSAWLE